MKRGSIFIVALSMLALSPFAMAVDAAGPWEFTLSGAGNNNKDFNAGAFGANLSLGYFFNDVVELSGRQTITYGDSGPTTSWSGSTRVAVDFHFPVSPHLRPFIGANLGFVYGDGVHDTMEAAPEAGLKYFVNNTTFLFGMAEYQFFFDNSDSLDSGFDNGQFVYTIGMGLRF